MTPVALTGTPNQISWAEIIRVRVDGEFDRVSRALVGRNRGDLLPILEDLRRQTLAHESAGFYIQHWGELNGQVRAMIVADPRYEMPARRQPCPPSLSASAAKSPTEPIEPLPR